ncbi:MAG: FAD binding domain-containing protein [Acetobacteraceae bacterium]|nr:FAD binding domain-containing protein [Acetobacteraceae bacterium]
MKPSPFTYRAALTPGEAVAALADPAAPRILAGGQSLVPMLNLRLAPADSLLDIRRIPELRTVTETATSIRYGALTTHAAFEDGAVPDGANGLMRHVGGQIAYRAVRNRGTIGGAIALADPAADWVTATIALEAVLHLRSAAGSRRIPVEEFVLGPYFTALEEGELIEAVEVPKRPASERWGHRKVVVKTGEYAESMAIALFDPARKTARLVLGAVDGSPLVLARAAEALLAGAFEDGLRSAIQADLAATDREFSRARLLMHTATAFRAAEAARAP